MAKYLCLILFIRNRIIHNYLILIVFFLSVIISFSTCFIKIKRMTNQYIKKAYILSNFVEELAKGCLDIFVISWIFKD
jgi:hypothetical protein